MRAVRFRGRKDVRSVLTRGLRVDRFGVSIRCLAGRARQHRIAVVCPKTVIRKAVERNRIRRLFFEAVRLLLRDVETPIDCVILVKPGLQPSALTRNDADALVGEITRMTARLCPPALLPKRQNR